jgi:hypothetical protein
MLGVTGRDYDANALVAETTGGVAKRIAIELALGLSW